MDIGNYVYVYPLHGIPQISDATAIDYCKNSIPQNLQKWDKSNFEFSEYQLQNPCHPLEKHNEIGGLSLSAPHSLESALNFTRK